MFLAKQSLLHLTACLLLPLLIFTSAGCRKEPNAASYVLDGLPGGMQMHLRINREGTYSIRSTSRHASHEETGTWKTEENDFVLTPVKGSLPYPVERLRPDEQYPGDLQWIVPSGGGWNSRAVSYLRFRRE